MARRWLAAANELPLVDDGDGAVLGHLQSDSMRPDLEDFVSMFPGDPMAGACGGIWRPQRSRESYVRNGDHRALTQQYDRL